MDEASKLNELIVLLKNKKKLLAEMNELTKSQTDNITEDKIESLNNIIREKDTVIKKVNKIDEKFSSIYDSLKEMLNVSGLEQSQLLPRDLLIELKAQTKEVVDLVSDMIAVDEDNRKKAKELKDSLAAEIRALNTSKQANVAYRGYSPYQGSYFIDKKK